MSTPIETLTTWWGTQSKFASLTLLLSVGSRLGFYTADIPVMEQRLSEWLQQPGPRFEQAGRVISMCALIDYALELFGRDEYWERALEKQLEVVELAHPLVRESANRQIGGIAPQREKMMACAQSWWVLRATDLHNDAVRSWEDSFENK